MNTLTEKIDAIKESVLKYVSAKYIFLFGSYAYGKPTEKSDIDISWIPLKFVTTFRISLYYKEIAKLLYFIVVTKYVTTINS
jgi:predicted nucleotidyltransferase